MRRTIGTNVCLNESEYAVRQGRASDDDIMRVSDFP